MLWFPVKEKKKKDLIKQGESRRVFNESLALIIQVDLLFFYELGIF